MRFETDFDGEVSRVRIKLEAAVDPIEFGKLPDESLTDAALFARHAGTYALGPITVDVLVDGETSCAQVAGQPRSRLLPKRRHLFTASEGDSTIEFVEEGDRGTRLVTSGAAFTRTDLAPPADRSPARVAAQSLR